MRAIRHTVSITTDASGDGTGYTGVIDGRIFSVQYVKTDYADGVDFACTGEETATAVWSQDNVNASATVAPRQATHSTAGVASLYAAGGEPVEACICLANERMKIVVSGGGATKSGTFHVIAG